MKKFIVAGLIAWGVAAGLPAGGAETTATQASAPSTRPQGPRDVLKTVISALYKGLPEDIAPNCQAVTPEAKRFVQDMADCALAVGTIHKSAEARFGPRGVEASTPQMSSPEAVDRAQETINGDTALVKGEGMGDTLMVRVNGQWKVDVMGLLQATGTTPDQMHLILTRMTAAIRAVAAKIDAGQYANIDAMRDGLLKAQGESQQFQEEQPTTAPAN